MRHVTARTAHNIPRRPPLRLTVGEAVQVGDRDTEWPEFVFVTASHGTGWGASEASVPAVGHSHRAEGVRHDRTTHSGW